MANIVAIVGRPNVGKSTLFNRLVEKKQAIMDDQSGVTRDKNYGYAEWIGKHFTIIDTGGYVLGSTDKFEKEIRKQVEMALEECDVILFMLDCKSGLTGPDEDFARVLRNSKKPILIVANKADNTELTLAANEFYSLGLSHNIYPVSSSNGSGTGELLDDLVALFPDAGEIETNQGIPRIAILGRPNVGKSSFINALIGEDRSIVTDEAGTTRDAVNSHYNLFGKELILTDTAGVRKKSKVRDNIEFYSVLRAIHALQDSDVCIIMVDAERGLESQDINLIALSQRYNKGIIIMINKWDLIEKESNTAKEIEGSIRAKLGLMDYAPIIFTSVLNKQRIFQVVELAIEVYENLQKKIPTSKLNEVMLKEIEKYPPPAVKGKYIRIKYVTQLPASAPVFAFFCNSPQYVKAPYQRYLENKIRLHFGFKGVPIRTFFRKK
ncbi:MAG: ribosome biogenesis GTPase Der [Cyclobacteriaceae bacterium]|nr:ribosome biogenesis GTPase Der [Cyclobacteriaceae bacterium]